MKSNATKFSGGEINTLAQSGTTPPKKRKQKPAKVVWGKGVDVTNNESLLNRAKRKTITQSLMLALADVATAREEHERANAYWDTYHCQRRLIESDKRLFGSYCKNRFCTICSSIRKADIINRYLPIMQEWQEPYFVTLTVKSVKAIHLNERIDRIVRSFRKILNCYKTRDRRGTGIKFVGVKSFECNFNPIKQTYNPHIHLIVANKEMAETLINEWLERCTHTHTRRTAQYMKAVDNREKALIEIVKYNSKIFTDPTMDKTNKRKKVERKIYVKAFHNIVWAMDGHRIFDRFGFNVPKKEKIVQRNETSDYNELIFSNVACDWICRENLEHLTGYEPSAELVDMLENDIDTELE